MNANPAFEIRYAYNFRPTPHRPSRPYFHPRLGRYLLAQSGSSSRIRGYDASSFDQLIRELVSRRPPTRQSTPLSLTADPSGATATGTTMTAAAKLEVLALASCLGMLVLLLALLLWSGLAELTDAIERRRSERESMSAASDYWPHQEQAGTSPETLAPATPGDGSSIRTIPNPYNIRVEPVPDLTAWRYPATDAFQGPLGDDEWLRKRANSGMHQPEFEDAGSDHELV